MVLTFVWAIKCQNVLSFTSPRLPHFYISSAASRMKQPQLFMVVEQNKMEDLDELQKIVKEASELSFLADTRVDELQERIGFLQDQIVNKETELKEGSDAWSFEKISLVAKVAELANLLTKKDEDENEESVEKVNGLEQEVENLKRNLEETLAALEESKQAAEEIRTRLLNGEDALEFEQMRFKKEKKEMEQKMEEDRFKMKQTVREFQKEQEQFVDERDGLIQKIDNALSQLLDTETEMATEKRQYDQESISLKTTIDGLKNNLVETQTRLKEETNRFSEERRDLSQQISEQRKKLQQTEKNLKETEREFRDTTKDLERKIADERDRVAKLTQNLEQETERFVTEKTDLQSQLSAERIKLAEAKTELDAETKRFETEKNDLEGQVSEGERIRKLKARQMNERYTAIRTELTEKLEATKREKRREEVRLTEKFDAKLQEVNENVSQLQGDLADAESNNEKITVQLSDMSDERDRILLEKDNSDRQFLQSISARNMEITGLKQDVESLNGAVVERDEVIVERDEVIKSYETSYRKLMKLSFQLTRKKLKNAPSKVANIVRRLKEKNDNDQ